MKCSQCQIEAAKFGEFWICSQHGQISATEKTFVPLRIFLSYGHDGNEDLVRRIKADLEKRGHDVWFDKSEIKAGDDWRRSITEGIARSDKFVSFLSKHSTRDPGVCRDEIAIAIGVKGGNIQTILVESEHEVQPPVNIGHIQWLDMHDWKERRAAGDAAWEQWYQAKLAEIVRVVESDESRRFAGEIETLGRYLKPIKSDARICQLLSKGFYGRQWLFEALEKWRLGAFRVPPSGGPGFGVPASAGSEAAPPKGGTLYGGTPSRLFWIMGAPGVGKSAFAAQLTHTRGDTVIAAQFCEWDKPDHRNAPRVVRSLAFQLATRLPDYRKLLLTLPEIAELDRKDAAELFDYLLANPLRSVISGGRQRYLIVIDALDEAGEDGRNPLVEMLARNAQRLPDWIGLVVTSRPEFDVKTPLQALNPFPLDTQSEPNRADIRDYLRRELASPLQNRPDADRLVEQILEKSEGVFLYVERFCDDVQRGHLSFDHPEQFPQGLGGIFADYFQRQFPDLEKFRKDVRPALCAILAAREPLPVEILQRLFNWQDEELRDFTRPLGSLFPVAIEADHQVIKPYHKSLADWLADAAKAGAYFVSLANGHERLAEFGWVEFQKGISRMSHYSRDHLPFHMAQTGRWKELGELVSSPQLGLIFRWIHQGEGDIGILCMEGLVNYLKIRPNMTIMAAGIATQLARIYSARADEDRAEKNLNFASSCTSWMRGRRVKAIALHELGSIYLQKSDYGNALRAYRSALRLSRYGFPVYHDEMAANLAALATVSLEMFNYADAVRLANQALCKAKRGKDRHHMVAALSLIGAAYRGQGEYRKALDCIKMAIGVCADPSTGLTTGELVLLRGWVQYDRATIARQPPTDALLSFKQALIEADQFQNQYMIADAKLSLAWCHLVLGEPAAIKLLKEITSIACYDRHDGLREGCALGNAVLAHRRGDYADARNAYQKVIDHSIKPKTAVWGYRACVGLGSVWWHSGEPIRAECAWNEAQRLASAISSAKLALVQASIDLCRDDAQEVPR